MKSREPERHASKDETDGVQHLEPCEVDAVRMCDAHAHKEVLHGAHRMKDEDQKRALIRSPARRYHCHTVQGGNAAKISTPHVIQRVSSKAGLRASVHISAKGGRGGGLCLICLVQKSKRERQEHRKGRRQQVGTKRRLAMADTGKTEYTVARALVQMKMIGKRVEKQVQEFEPVCIQTGAKLEQSMQNKSLEQFQKETKADWQSLMDLLELKRKLKCAVVLSNATTSVEVAGTTYTVAEVIERKAQIELEREMVRNLREKYARKLRQVESKNTEMEAKMMKLLEATYAKRESQLNKEDYERITGPFLENNESKLIDPISIDAKLQEFEKRIEEFEAECDVTLSISNARAIIYV
ncbi:hypothetical protein FVE85_0978 [Porphyridium purpureum]|uniref:Uncharacterized protein n=1 Tax=Porphyridium purpureum TaxID=35688 RepID=A0A5J4Z051_PORPP|nr:hypothetical protein FVE85_0978 [Porphyridium purpureum]|eukprot:POR8005..scf208_2